MMSSLQGFGQSLIAVQVSFRLQFFFYYRNIKCFLVDLNIPLAEVRRQAAVCVWTVHAGWGRQIGVALGLGGGRHQTRRRWGLVPRAGCRRRVVSLRRGFMDLKKKHKTRLKIENNCVMFRTNAKINSGFDTTSLRLRLFYWQLFFDLSKKANVYLHVFSERAWMGVGLVTHFAEIGFVWSMHMHMLFSITTVCKPSVAAFKLTLEWFLSWKNKNI